MELRDRTYNSVLLEFENILIALIICIILTGFIFFLFAFYKRLKRIKESKQKIEFQLIIDKLLFEFLFDNKDLEEIIQREEYQKNFESGLFKRVTIKSILSLHQNYSGIYNTKLESFYVASNLANYSLEQLNSNYWPHIVEGIRDLSGLNHQKSYPRIVSYKNHDNEMVRTEVLLGMIRLKGISEILKFKNSELYLNDWVQSNILYTVKIHRIEAPKNLLELLYSKNKSIVLLAVRLINYYKSVEHYPALSEFYQQTKDRRLKHEIEIALNKTEQLS